MDDISKNTKKQSSAQQQSKNDQNEEHNSDKFLNFEQIELSDEQKIQQNLFLKQFTEFSTSMSPKFLAQEYEFRLIENIILNSNLFHDIYRFYEDQRQNAEQIKNKILLRLNNFHYSMNHLSIIAKFFHSYSSFQNFCNSAQIILSNSNFLSPPYQIFENVILTCILKTHRNLNLNNLYVKFKHFSLIRRREILNIAVDRFLSGMKNDENSIPILNNSREHIIKELSRLSHHLGINFDVNEHDGQHFIYTCETLLGEYQRINFSFNLIQGIRSEPKRLIDCINNSFMDNFSKDELIIEAFENIIHPNNRYNIIAFNSINNKSFPSEQINALISLRFCRNRQLLSELEKSTIKLFKYRRIIYQNLQIELKDNDSTLCDRYISFIIEQILIFSSAVYQKSEKKADLDLLLEISIEKHLRYTNAKNKILSSFEEISKHSNSLKVIEFMDQIIDKRPNLVFSQFSFYELFEKQIETLEVIGNCFSILINLQILTERQITAFYGTFFEPFQFGTFYSNLGEGEFNISNFEVYPSIEKVLNFFSISPKIVDEICSSMSIKSIEYSDYVELAVWTQLLNEVNQRPEVSIFSADFSAIHFNLPLSKDVESLINCRLLDDPLFLKKFEERIDHSSSLKSKFTQNLANFCLLVSKLRSLIYKTNLYLPLFLRQYDEAHFSVGTTRTIEFVGKPFNFSNFDEIEKICLSGNFSKIIEMINHQRRYNTVLMIAIRYNNFRSDNYIMSFLFNIVRPDSNLFITKSDTNDDEKTRFYQEAAKKFFVGFDSFINQDFSSIFFDISDVSDFGDIQNLINFSKIYLNRIELATITNFERVLLHDFQQIELFTLNSQFYRPTDGFVNYFSIPNYSQCLLLDCDHTKFDQILNLVAARLKLISFVRFTSFIKFGRNRSFGLLYNRQIAWQSTFLSKLNSAPKKTVSEALNLLNSEFLFETGKLDLAILLLIQKVFQTKRACHLKEKVKPTNLSLIPDEEIREFWKMVNQERDTDSINAISIERYIPIYLSRFNFTFSDTLKNELQNEMHEIDKKVERNVIYSDSQDNVFESSQFVLNEIVNELLKFSLLRLKTKFPFTKLNKNTLIDITRHDYKENLPFYTNFVVTPAKQQLSKGTEQEMNKLTIQFAIQFILKVVETAQKKLVSEKSTEISEQLEFFNSLGSPLKPEFYMKKKQFSIQKKQTYNPNPEDARRQFEQEMRYARSKIVSMLIRAMNHSSNNENEKVLFNSNTNLNSTIIFDSKSLISKLIPLSSYLFNFLERSSIQILKTWPSYIQQMKTVTFENIEEDIFLNDLVKSIKENFNMALNYHLSVRNFNEYITLDKLREKERSTNKEQHIYDDEITKEIRNEYENKLNEIKKEHQEVLKQFPIVHDKYFRQFENVIQKQNEKVPSNEEILKPNHEIALKSLKPTEESRKEVVEIKRDEELQNKIQSDEEEERKKKDKEFQEQARKKLRKLPSFNLTSIQTLQPNTHSKISPSKSNPAIDDSAAAFAPREPPSTSKGEQFMRKKAMVKSQTQASLFEVAKQKEKEKENMSILRPKKHITSDTSQSSKELSDLISSTKKDDSNNIKNNFQSNEKFKAVENDISELRRTIIKLRITKCLFKIAVSNNYKKIMNKVSQEKKEASMLLWFNRRSYEEDTREIKDEIENCFKRLSTAEKESDILKQELEDQKIITTKLAHWKELNLRSSDQILKQIGVYQKGPNVEVSKLLKKLEEKREELDALNKEANEFENQLIDKVREPMNEMSRIRRVVQNQKYQNLKMQANLNRESASISARIQKYNDDNNKLELENKKLKLQISQLENQKAQIPSVKIEETKELFELNQPPTARRMKTSYVSASRKTSLTSKSPYAKYGYKSIKKPLS